MLLLLWGLLLLLGEVLLLGLAVLQLPVAAHRDVHVMVGVQAARGGMGADGREKRSS
jgi:hypothetical protein